MTARASLPAGLPPLAWGLLLALLLALASPGAGGAQDSLPALPDTYGDPGVEALLAKARGARDREIRGIDSYEAVMRERIYVGMSAFRFRRERGLFQQERAARFRWTKEGERAVQWLGARRRIPLVGTNDEISQEIRREVESELMISAIPGPLAFDPWDESFTFGNDWALHPLGDSAGLHYRYYSGDTLTIRLPGQQGDVRMIEARVEPREREFELLAASLWFDAETGSLVRATYRPARPFNLELDEPEDAEEVPAIFKPITAEIDYITVEYGLYEFEFWLPRRFGFEGQANLGRVLSVPISLEYVFTDYAVNETESAIPLAGDLPPGWTRSERRVEDETGRAYVTVVVPPEDSLETSVYLPETSLGTTPSAFTEAELRELQKDLRSLLPAPEGLEYRLDYGFRGQMTRFNRVEGLSTGVRGEVALGGLSWVGGSARIGFDLEPNGEIFFRRGDRASGWQVGAYRRLWQVNRAEDPFTLGSSTLSFAFGYEDAHFYRGLGAEALFRGETRRTRRHLRLFAERQDPADRITTFYLTGAISGGAFPPNLRAEKLDVVGGEAGLDWQWGLDPAGLIASGSVRAEGGWGESREAGAVCLSLDCPPAPEEDRSYGRVWASTALTHPLFWNLAGALEVGGGWSWGNLSPQREFYLGSYSNLRGFRGADRLIFGNSAWMGRLELANRLPAARITVFSDVGWAGSRDDFRMDDPFVNVGVGASLLDGILRFDLARGVRVASGSMVPREWRIHFYLDGLF